MIRIKVDFNNLVRQGQVRASVRHADGEVNEGQTVEAFDPAEGLSYEATVVEIDEASGRVYLEPHWEPTADRPTKRRVRIYSHPSMQTVNGTNTTVRRLHYDPPPPATRVAEGVLVDL